ncbi:MAG: rhomboid family intramembrane serine protease [Candidatus Anammoximicrobium sp.]|nr:rhomboid family intramembrane serine protease [Candidatus Anammoximicrobium sp.]
MALHEREYYRDDRRPPLHFAERLMVTNLVILNVAIYLIDTFLGGEHWLQNALSLSSADLAKPWLWWKFLTYGFAHHSDVAHVFWNMLGLWMFGRDVEMVYGRREFLRIYVLAVILGSAVWALRCLMFGSPQVEHVLLGASGAVTAVILLFVLHYPKRTILLMFVLPVPAWVLGALVIGGNVMEMVGSQPTPGRQNIAFDVHLAGAAFAILYFRFGWSLGGLLPALFSPRSSWKRFQRKPRLRIHDPDPDDGDVIEEGDRLLIKVHREGEASLTAKERRVLEAYSRRMREKHRHD